MRKGVMRLHVWATKRGKTMRHLRTAALACGLLLLSGCATQTYRAQHASDDQLAQIHELHVVSVVAQDQLDAEHNTMYLNAVPMGAVTGAAIAGGLIAGALISAEANHEANVFAEKYIAPLRTTLAGFDGRAAVRDAMQQGMETLPARVVEWKTIDAETNDSDLLPPGSSAGAAWLILHTGYAMTPDFSGLQVITNASLYVYDSATDWRKKPVYRNDYTYQSELLQTPAKTDDIRKRIADQENARYAKLDVDGQVRQVNAADNPYDVAVAHQRQEIHAEKWQHQAHLKQIASATWSTDERADWFVNQWQADGAAALKAAISEGGQQTVRMLALDIMQSQPRDAAKAEWRTVYRDAQRSIQDAPDGEVYSVANGDVTHGAFHVNQTMYFNVVPTGAR
jgi:hypothetical protein